MSESVLIKTAVEESGCRLVADGGDTKKLLHILISIVVAVWEPGVQFTQTLQLHVYYEQELTAERFREVPVTALV